MTHTDAGHEALRAHVTVRAAIGERKTVFDEPFAEPRIEWACTTAQERDLGTHRLGEGAPLQQRVRKLPRTAPIIVQLVAAGDNQQIDSLQTRARLRQKAELLEQHPWQPGETSNRFQNRMKRGCPFGGIPNSCHESRGWPRSAGTRAWCRASPEGKRH